MRGRSDSERVNAQLQAAPGDLLAAWRRRECSIPSPVERFVGWIDRRDRPGVVLVLVRRLCHAA